MGQRRNRNATQEVDTWRRPFSMTMLGIQYHPGYKNLEIRPKSLGVMCGPPPFGELRVLTRRIRFTFLGAPRVLTAIFFGLGHAGPQISFQKNRLLTFDLNLCAVNCCQTAKARQDAMPEVENLPLQTHSARDHVPPAVTYVPSIWSLRV